MSQVSGPYLEQRTMNQNQQFLNEQEKPSNNKHYQQKENKDLDEISIQQQQKEQKNRISQNSQSFYIYNIDLKGSIFGITQTQAKQFQENLLKPLIQITHLQVQQIGNTLNKYLIFTIQGLDKHGKFLIKRKYSEFKALRKLLFQRWPGCYIPSIKIKSDTINGIKSVPTNNMIIQQTFQLFIIKNFLIELSYSSFLYYKEQVQLFLRSPDIEIDEIYKQMPKLQNKDIINQYIDIFGEDILKDQGIQSSQNFIEFHKKLRRIITSIRIFSEKILKLADSFSSYSYLLSKFSTIMLNYQHLTLSQFSKSQTIFVKDEQNHIQEIKKANIQNPFYELYFHLLSQQNDNQSYLDVIIVIGLYDLRIEQLENQRNSITTEIVQINEGQKTLKTITNRKTKEQTIKKLQQKINKIDNQISQLKQINIIIQNIVLNTIAPLFKQLKQNQYRLFILKWIKHSQSEIQEDQNIWKFINEESKNMIKKYSKLA